MGLPSGTCRLCAASGNLCVSVFGNDGDKNHLQHKLRICSPVIVRESDKLPTQVCLTCLSSLDQTYEFYQQIKQAQSKLRTMVDMDTDSNVCSSESYGQGNVKRQSFGSTILTYSCDPEDTNGDPPLFVTVNETTNGGAESGADHSEQASSVESGNADCVNRDHSSKESEPPAEPRENKCIKRELSPVNDTASRSKKLNTQSAAAPSLSSPKSVAEAQSTTSEAVEGTNSSSPKASDTPANVPEPQIESSSVKDGAGPSFRPCRFCQRLYPEHLLAAHEDLHPQGRKAFSCERCKRSFFFEEAYKRHVLKHDRND